MTTEAEEFSITKRRLILRDSLTFLSLILITVVLFVLTLLLFRSFQAHRAELATRWSDRGAAALQAGRPDQAITAYRTALLYAPGEHSYELMLARALGEAGHTEESYNYFMGLWEMRPGDGFINFQLARLAAKKNEVQDAINYYRASIYGTWEGDGVERRRHVRLELARYLIAKHDPSAARTELLIAGGNAPDTPAIDLELAKLLEQAAAPADALTYYQKALAHEPKNLAALSGAGQLAYAMGDYGTAHKLLEREMRERSGIAKEAKDAEDAGDAGLLTQSERILQLAPTGTMSARERVRRILAVRTIAKQRLSDCTAQLQTEAALPVALQTLTGRWTGSDGTSNAKALLEDSDLQASALQLVYDTEMETSQVCAAPKGDDALLLLLAQASRMKAR